MLNSTVVQDYTLFSSVPYSAYVDPAPFIPDPSYDTISKQKRATQLYNLELESDTTSSVDLTQSYSKPDDDIQSAVKSYLNGAYFVDGSIAKLISENLDELF